MIEDEDFDNLLSTILKIMEVYGLEYTVENFEAVTKRYNQETKKTIELLESPEMKQLNTQMNKYVRNRLN